MNVIGINSEQVAASGTYHDKIIVLFLVLLRFTQYTQKFSSMSLWLEIVFAAGEKINFFADEYWNLVS